MPINARLTHTRLLVEDYAETFVFYRDVLGLEPTFGDEDSGYADFETGDVTLALFDAAEMDAAVDGDEMDTAVSGDRSTARGRDQVVVIFEVANVDTVASDLQASGGDLVAEPTDHPEWGIRTAHCRDPDGNLLEFNHPLD